MATIADTLYKPDGTALTSQVVAFVPYDGPWLRGASTTSSAIVTATTHATTGALAASLLEGAYKVLWRTSPALGSRYNECLIYVPPGSSTYTLGSIKVSTGGTVFDVITTVTHPHTMVSGVRYQYLVGTRDSEVTVYLPDPGSTGQKIEVLDSSGQAATYNVTIDGGTKSIDFTGATAFRMDRTGSVMSLLYTGALWKIT